MGAGAGGGAGVGDATTTGTSGGEGEEGGSQDGEGGRVVEDEGEEGGEERMLGAGVFVRSGDIVPLLAATSSSLDDNSAAGTTGGGGGGGMGACLGGWACVTEGKGYCIARPGAAPLDVHLIKVGGTTAYFRSDFLCNGDVVILRNSVNGKYLSVYKGWWLWWTPNPPSSSSSRAHFVIAGLDEGERLTVGRSFKLRHNKWASYEVGISDSVNSEYGGRMLGLYQTSNRKRMFQSKKSKTWLSPLQLKFQAPRGEEGMGGGREGGVLPPQMPLDDGSMVVVEDEDEGEEGAQVGGRKARKAAAAAAAAAAVGGGEGGVGGEDEPASPLEGMDPFFVEKAFTPEEVEEGMVVDVPAWIEMVHRHKKKPQLAYALRVRFRHPETGEETVRWMALRTGIDLAFVIQMQRRRQLHKQQTATAAAVAAAASAAASVRAAAAAGRSPRSGEGVETGREGGVGGSGSSSGSSSAIAGGDRAYMLKGTPSKGTPSKGKGKASKSSKEGKGSEEGGGGGGGRRRSRGPSMDGLPPPLPSTSQPLHHQNPADQSVRLLAQLLSEINSSLSSSPSSSAPTTPTNAVATTPRPSPPSTFRHTDADEADELDEDPPLPSCKAALYSILRRRNYLDAWFLTGTAADMAVTVPSKPSGPPLQQSMVARALWESHWKEEWMVLYSSHVSFFSMGTKKPGWSVFLHDILAVKVPQGASKLRAQFPGKFFLGLETLGRVHYLCFGTEAIRDNWLSALAARVGGQAAYEIPVGVVISDPREAFVLKSGQWRPASRIILNARRMSFDVAAPAATAALSMSPSQLSEKALRLVYDLSPDSGTERLVAFLDLCSSFRVLPLHLLDLDSAEALAFFLNIYHTLLQHALLLLGPPSSKDWSAFFASVSYELGTDVFSLTELEHCVLRGRLSRPRTVPRHMPSPPHLDDDHYSYALGKSDYRINFALINGSISAPPFVTVFRAAHLEEQLDKASVRFVDYTLKVDTKKRLVILPKVCDIYRGDFSSTMLSKETMKVCLRFLDRTKWERISWLLAGAKAPSVKYTSNKSKCHETLCLIEDRLSTSLTGAGSPRNAATTTATTTTTTTTSSSSTSTTAAATTMTTPLLAPATAGSPPMPVPLLLLPPVDPSAVGASGEAARTVVPSNSSSSSSSSSSSGRRPAPAVVAPSPPPSAGEDFDEEEEDEDESDSGSDELEGRVSDDLEETEGEEEEEEGGAGAREPRGSGGGGGGSDGRRRSI